MRPNVAHYNALCDSTVLIKTDRASGSKRVRPVFCRRNALTRASGIPRIGFLEELCWGDHFDRIHEIAQRNGGILYRRDEGALGGRDGHLQMLKVLSGAPEHINTKARAADDLKTEIVEFAGRFVEFLRRWVRNGRAHLVGYDP